jgi:hypothetical protein
MFPFSASSSDPRRCMGRRRFRLLIHRGRRDHHRRGEEDRDEPGSVGDLRVGGVERDVDAIADDRAPSAHQWRCARSRCRSHGARPARPRTPRSPSATTISGAGRAGERVGPLRGIERAAKEGVAGTVRTVADTVSEHGGIRGRKIEAAEVLPPFAGRSGHTGPGEQRLGENESERVRRHSCGGFRIKLFGNRLVPMGPNIGAFLLWDSRY